MFGKTFSFSLWHLQSFGGVYQPQNSNPVNPEVTEMRQRLSAVVQDPMCCVRYIGGLQMQTTRRVIYGLMISYFLIALGLVFSQSPSPVVATKGKGMDFTAAMTADYSNPPPLRTFIARDSTPLPFRTYESVSKTSRILILVHGSAWHGLQLHPMAQSIASKGIARVIVPDLRGHGENPTTRGTIAYFTQLEDDLADLIAHVSKGQDNPQIILGGHSSGGGLAVRFAGGEHGNLADRFILIAPFLKHDAPTTRPYAGDWAFPAIRRITGLTMLSKIGIGILNHLPVISFALPQEVLDGPSGDTATTTYSYRMNVGFAPRSDYETDLAAMKQPFLLLSGGRDEVFFSDKYESVISKHTSSGTYVILDDIDHLGIVIDKTAISSVGKWLTEDR